ncbi:TetR/AcrR family transcriptional regulator [Longispora sp. NPDC051575]|uniref:TetR/AcrR family transcriptional regulator n=1 Tax=Longispora sp. NPDC051575 TaxID=3154943 RepID=UPI003420D95F
MSKGELTKQAVLEEATTIAARLGLEGLTIGSLATSMNMSKSGLFGHFRSKEALQLQVLAHARENFTHLVLRPALAAPRGEPRLQVMLDRWLDLGLTFAAGCLFVSAATEFDDREGPVREQLVHDHQDMLDSVAQMFRAGVSEGTFRADADAEQFAHDVNGVMLGFYHAFRLLRDPLAETRARRAFDTLLNNARP